MSITPSDLRGALATAVVDDILNNQPELDHRRVDRETGHAYEVRGFINPARLGAFGSDQIARVIDTRHPGLLAHLNDQPPTEITEAEILDILGAPDASPGKTAREIATLIRQRHAYRPGFLDL